MKITDSISAGISKMESKLIGNQRSSLNQMETGSMSENELIAGPSMRMQEPTSMAIARLFARTLLIMTIIIGSIILISVYIQSKSMHCAEYISSAESNHHHQHGPYFEPMLATSEPDDEYNDGSSTSSRQIPLSLRLSGRAGEMMNSIGDDEKGHVNCVIERKTANQIIASEPKKLMTPFGNITTDPRLVHLTGEKLIFSCHSGDDDQNDKTIKGIGDGDKQMNEANTEPRPLPFPNADDKLPSPPAEFKPIRQLIIISGPHRPFIPPAENNEMIGSNEIDDNNNKVDKVDSKSTLNEEVKNKETEPTSLNSIQRSKREAPFQMNDDKKKECSCKCSC